MRWNRSAMEEIFYRATMKIGGGSGIEDNGEPSVPFRAAVGERVIRTNHG